MAGLKRVSSRGIYPPFPHGDTRLKTQVIKLNQVALALQSLGIVKASLPPTVKHFIVIDVSGSMSYDLPKVRADLKNKLVTLVGDNDTVTIIWFSGRRQSGVLIEDFPIRTAGDLKALHQAIDRYLVPVGLTGFKEPLEDVLAVIDRIDDGKSLLSMFFMSDGYDNCWSEREILAVCAKLAPRLSSAVVVEYGWSCNRKLMAAMAETLGGTLIFSRDLSSYQLTFEEELSRGGRTKKVLVKLKHRPTYGYAFAYQDGALLTFAVDESLQILVPEGVTEVAYYVDGSVGGDVYDLRKHKQPQLWAGLATLSQRMKSDAIFEVLAAMGDVALVNLFSSCFSKEDYVMFVEEALGCARDPKLRYVQGYDANAVPKEDAYTVLDVINELSSSDENKFYPRHESFRYERTGAATVAKEGELRFATEEGLQGFPVHGVVWHESRPNLSIRVQLRGSVTLPEDRPKGLPQDFPTFIYRTYTIILDGVVHARTLPVSLSAESFQRLQAQGLLSGESYEPGKVYVLTFPKLPVINRKMVTQVTAKDTFAKVLELAQLKGEQKVFKEFKDRVSPKTSQSFLAIYGEAATTYLTEKGITDTSGFSPASDRVKSGDVYMAHELKIAGKGLSSLPAVAAVEKLLASGKAPTKVSDYVMSVALGRIKEFQDSTVYQKAANKDALMATWIDIETVEVIKRTRALMHELSKSKFAIVVGHTWFSDLASLDDKSLDVVLPGFGPVSVTASLSEIEIEK